MVSPLEDALAADRGIFERFGMRLVSADAGACVLRADVHEQLVNAAGFAHGGLLFALADTACAYALSSLETRGVTLASSLNFVRGARAGDLLEARAEVVSRTRRTASLRSEVRSSAELLAHGTFAFVLTEKS